ncbi:MAG: hypothetical protein KF678_03045 [Phycisphaeraceae bacterium]|nr:hypothetical protein [Phycisphaeraceae bacterium]
MRSARLFSFAALAAGTTLTVLSVATAQPERPSRPEGRPPEGRQPEGRPEGRPGGRSGAEVPNVEASMKGLNRALQQLRDQVGDPAKKDACLKLIGDAQRGCINAKAGTPHQVADIKDEAAKAKAAESYRKHLIAVARKLLDVEQNIMEGKGDAARAGISELLKMRDAGHEEFGVD